MDVLKLLPAAALLAACGGPPTGQVNPAWGDTAVAAEGTTELRVYLGPAGTVRGLAVYHGDRGRIPPAVLARGDAVFPGKSAISFESEWHAIGPVFEVEYDLGDGQHGEIAATADGTLLYTERTLPIDAVPASLQQAALARVGGGEIVSAETKASAGQTATELKVKHGDRTHVVSLADDGRVLWHAVRFMAQVEVPVP
ncbi:MAG: hypothetical protein KC549_16010 [Myxococcales bacterium]|nr:hypothetical protein [Myxococcales bacterium]MCB9550219.1 hypothetical protein [Myxococcales bacterium]